MTARTGKLTEPDLNRALRVHQVLLERIGGLQARYAPPTYIGLWSGLEDFEDVFTRALDQRDRLAAFQP